MLKRKAMDKEDRMQLAATEAAEAIHIRYPAIHHPASALLEIHCERQARKKRMERRASKLPTIMESETVELLNEYEQQYAA